LGSGDSKVILYAPAAPPPPPRGMPYYGSPYAAKLPPTPQFPKFGGAAAPGVPQYGAPQPQPQFVAPPYHTPQAATSAGHSFLLPPEPQHHHQHHHHEHNKRKLSAISLMPPPVAPVEYLPSGLQDVYSWYINRQLTSNAHLGHRAIVENLIIYFEGLKVTYRDKDLSLTESLNWKGTYEARGGPQPIEAFRDHLCSEQRAGSKKTCSFINDTVLNFLHTGTIASLCMIETISSYFIPICNGAYLTNSEYFQELGRNFKGFAGFKRITNGYKPGDCGSLTIYRDGTYTLKAYGLIVVVGMDFVAATCTQVDVSRLTTSSIRMLHPCGSYSLPKHVSRYPNAPLSPSLPLPLCPVPGSHVLRDRRC